MKRSMCIKALLLAFAGLTLTACQSTKPDVTQRRTIEETERTLESGIVDDGGMVMKPSTPKEGDRRRVSETTETRATETRIVEPGLDPGQ